ncbi:MAG: glycosyltransferase family 2 protein [Eubacteriales bacterium]|nr:glycosyltransferase family 2 protein [Eubacteriales bacterium]
MFITVCVIAYNEEKTIKSILEDIRAQDYEHGKIEVMLVNSASTDSTRRIMEEFRDANASRKNDSTFGFKSVAVLDNPKKTLPCGWNVALGAYTGEAVLKVDAHSSIPKDFVSKNVNVLELGEDVCGGQRPNIIDDDTPWKETLLLAESSMFGSSIAPYRNNPGRTYVKSMFHAAYRRNVFDTIGNFNEKLARTEDNEIHYRMRKAGFKLCFDPEIISYQHIRSSLPKMLKQKYSNGYWIALTSGVCPKCLSIYHFVPFAFVVAIILSSICCAVLGIVKAAGAGFGMLYGIAGGIIYTLTGLMWGVYWLMAVIMAVIAVIGAKNKRNITCIALPFLFFMLHISYGAGTLIGMIKMPSWVKGIRNERN